MIVDRLENWRHYLLGPAWGKVFEFLLSLSPETDEGEYPMQGEELFARVMSYETRQPSEAVLESHRKYADIQAVLHGGEGFEWFPAAGLPVETPYDGSRDAEFYRRISPGPARVNVFPGVFLLFLPQDAHMPGLTIGETPRMVKKVVVKVKVELLSL